MQHLPMRIFIVEDDKWYNELLCYHLSLNPDYELHQFYTAEEALAKLHLKPDVITLDYSIEQTKGDTVLKKIKAYHPDITVIMISGQEDIETAIGLLREGAYDYFVKNDETKDRLWNALIKIRENRELKEELEVLREEVGKKYDYSNTIIGNSDGIKKIYSLIEKATKTNINVSITGETGTGKELVAKAIHYHSNRKKKAFVAVNVAAIPTDLMESELFGYEKGAFTGALNRRIGKFEEADGGTLFLDEIGELDLNMQTKLLRALQEKEITRIGGTGVVKIDTRIITATHKDLQEEVNKGKFREDLYYRLMGLPINIPPLRERGNDVLLLAKHFITLFCKENHLKKKTLAVDAQQKLMGYAYPGNVRELGAVMQLAVVMSDENEMIEASDINLQASNKIPQLLQKELTLHEYTKNIIQSFLDKYDGDVQLVADKLDMGKSTIYKMIKDGELTQK